MMVAILAIVEAKCQPIGHELHLRYDEILFPRPLSAGVEKGTSGAPETVRWNALLLDAIRINRTFPPMASRRLAIAHVAMFDAANSISRLYRPAVQMHEAQDGASPEAAIAAAAHHVARTVFPAFADDWDAELTASLGRIDNEDGREKGRSLGIVAGTAALQARANDGSNLIVSYEAGSAPGQWRPTRPDFLPPLNPEWGGVTPTLFRSPTEFMSPPPPLLASMTYSQEYHEVARLGEFFSEERTTDETQIAIYWADPPGSVSPPGRWNVIATQFIQIEDLAELEAARLYAILNVAVLDAGIVCWHDKYRYNFWRPVTAINLGDLDGNPETESDPFWIPYLLTPRHPEYPSGHSAFSGAGSAVLTAWFGSDRPFELPSDAMPETFGIPNFTRNFTGFEHAAGEASASRVYAGLHFRSACSEGLISGGRVGRFAVGTYLLPNRASGWRLD